MGASRIGAWDKKHVLVRLHKNMLIKWSTINILPLAFTYFLIY